MNTWQLVMITAVSAFIVGYGTGHHQKTVSDNAKIVKQVVKVAKVDAKNEAEVEKQDDSDKLKIVELEQDLATARADAAKRGVPKYITTKCMPSPKTDARSSEEAGATREPAGGNEASYRALRDGLLVAGAVAEQLRLQVLSCQAQWPQ